MTSPVADRPPGPSSCSRLAPGEGAVRRRRALTARGARHGLLGLLLTGCPEEPPLGPCASGSEPVLRLANRDGQAELTAGSEVEVFPPPQGGVFAELDVTIDELAAEDLLNLRVTVEDASSGQALATVRYFGNSLPLYCTEDDTLTVNNLPVGFDESIRRAEELDGVPVVITGTLELADRVIPERYEVVLRASEY